MFMAKGKPFERDVDFYTIARSTTGFTGADLANLLNEAALLAARRGKSLIGMNDIEDAMIKVMVGPSKKSKVVNERDRKLTAYHEAGHAVVTFAIQPETPVHQISIIPSGRGAGGYTLSIPKEDRSYMSKNDMQNEIVTLLAGRMAEKLIMGDISTGASNDIQRATGIARNMVTRYGMSDDLGPIVYGSEHSSDEVFLGRDFSSGRNYSEETASLIDNEIKRIIGDAYKTAENILREKMDKLHFIAQFLIKDEIMDEEQFKAAMTGNPTVEELEEMLSERRRRSNRENEEKAKRDEEERLRREEEERKRLEAEAQKSFGIYRPENIKGDYNGTQIEKSDSEIDTASEDTKSAAGETKDEPTDSAGDSEKDKEKHDEE